MTVGNVNNTIDDLVKEIHRLEEENYHQKAEIERLRAITNNLTTEEIRENIDEMFWEV